jgi:putative membrane protein
MNSKTSKDEEIDHVELTEPRPGAIGLVLRGLCMGAADVVPGVSGGTMAFILGIYERLIASIRAFTRPEFWRPVLKRDWRVAAATVDITFLLFLGAGILGAILLLAKPIAWLLENRPVMIWSFFLGLILASIDVVRRKVRRWTSMTYLLLALGAIGAYLLVGLVPVATPEAPWFIFLSGAIAICAMILPGISGSFILVLLGKYDMILAALNERRIGVILVFSSGCAVGILAFSNLLNRLLKRHHDPTVALLTGFMLGSLRKVWPWKETLLSMTNRHGKIVPVLERNILPESGSPEIMIALAAAGFGLILVFALEALAARRQAKLEKIS